jgi:hypothetical protein
MFVDGFAVYINYLQFVSIVSIPTAGGNTSGDRSFPIHLNYLNRNMIPSSIITDNPWIHRSNQSPSHLQICLSYCYWHCCDAAQKSICVILHPTYSPFFIYNLDYVAFFTVNSSDTFWLLSLFQITKPVIYSHFHRLSHFVSVVSLRYFVMQVWSSWHAMVPLVNKVCGFVDSTLTYSIFSLPSLPQYQPLSEFPQFRPLSMSQVMTIIFTHTMLYPPTPSSSPTSYSINHTIFNSQPSASLYFNSPISFFCELLVSIFIHYVIWSPRESWLCDLTSWPINVIKDNPDQRSQDIAIDSTRCWSRYLYHISISVTGKPYLTSNGYWRVLET